VVQFLHLVRRFFGSVRPGPPSAADEVWAREHLNDGERTIWSRMSNPDRRHAVGVARAVDAGWSDAVSGTDGPPSPDRAVLAAALLHDSGKVVSELRTPARVAATVLWAVLDDDTADRWIETAGGRRVDPRLRLAQYRRHPELGAELLRRAGSDPLTADWAEQHHRPEQRWTVPVEVGRLLKACDDD
jgi:hypothetical protein